jgi:hypothetical protein
MCVLRCLAPRSWAAVLAAAALPLVACALWWGALLRPPAILLFLRGCPRFPAAGPGLPACPPLLHPWALVGLAALVALVGGRPPLRRGLAAALAGAASEGWAAAGAFWRAALYLGTVRSDVFGRARAPIPTRVGPQRTPGEVVLVAAAPPRAARVLAHFWKHGRDQSCGALARLFPGGGGLVVSGVLAVAGEAAPPRPPLAFCAEIDPAARTAALTHARGRGAPLPPAAGEQPLCVHAAAPLELGSADLAAVLAPLVSRRPCPSGGA